MVIVDKISWNMFNTFGWQEPICFLPLLNGVGNCEDAVTTFTHANISSSNMTIYDDVVTLPIMTSGREMVWCGDKATSQLLHSLKRLHDHCCWYTCYCCCCCWYCGVRWTIRNREELTEILAWLLKILNFALSTLFQCQWNYCYGMWFPVAMW